MSDQRLRVWVFPDLKKSLLQRYPAAPLGELLQLVRTHLSEHAIRGRQAPFPYPQGVLMHIIETEIATGSFRVVPIYQIDEEDNGVEVFEIGIVELEGP